MRCRNVSVSCSLSINLTKSIFFRRVRLSANEIVIQGLHIFVPIYLVVVTESSSLFRLEFLIKNGCDARTDTSTYVVPYDK